MTVVMMITGTIKGQNANDHFYYRLAKAFQEQGYKLVFYVLSEPPAAVKQQFHAVGAELLVYGLGGKPRLPRSLQVFQDAGVLWFRYRPEILVGQYSLCGNVASLLAAFTPASSIKVVRATSTQVKAGFFHKFKQKLFTQVLGNVVVAVSEAVCNDLVNVYGIHRSKIRILKNALCPDDYQPSVSREAVRDGLGIEASDVVLICVAEFVPIKGHAHLLRAMKKANFGESVKLLLVGDGPTRGSSESLCQQLDLGTSVQFLGRRNDVANLLHASDISVLVSETDAFPQVVMESMVAALPVIGSDVDGIPELVSDGETGILVEVANIEAIRHALEMLVKERTMAKAMGQKGQEKLLAEFNMQLRIENEIQMYRSLLSRNTVG